MLRLFVDFRVNERHARQGLALGDFSIDLGHLDELGGLLDHRQVHGNRIRNAAVVRMHDDHFAREQEEGIAKAAVHAQAEAALEDEHFDALLRVIFHHDGGPGNGGGDGSGADLGAANSLGHLKKHGPFLEGHLAGAGLKAKETLRPDAGKSVVLKEKLGAGLDPGLEADLVLDHLVNGGRVDAGCGIEHGNLVDDLVDARFGQRACLQPSGKGKKENEGRDAKPNRSMNFHTSG